MLCDMSQITRGNFFRFEVAKLPLQTWRPPAQGLMDANPAYVRGVGLARARPGLVGPRLGRSPARAKPRRSGAKAVGACGSPPALENMANRGTAKSHGIRKLTSGVASRQSAVALHELTGPVVHGFQRSIASTWIPPGCFLPSTLSSNLLIQHLSHRALPVSGDAVEL
jgi:hypothetical protein